MNEWMNESIIKVMDYINIMNKQNKQIGKNEWINKSTNSNIN